MKPITTLGLAVVAAAALMAFVGASTASADVLCSVNNTPECPKANVVTSLESSLKAGASSVLRTTAGEEIVTCTQSGFSGTVEKQGEGVEPEGPISSLTWGGCNHTTNTVATGRFKVETREPEPGVHKDTVTASASEVTISILGVTCTYGPGANPISLGDLTVGSPAIVDVDTIVNRTAGNTMFCPPTARWTATYQITKPTGLWLSEK